MRTTLIVKRARAMRKEMTPPEVMLWSRLRGRRPDKPTFRRQHPMGWVILDFYCPSARLAVEVDGSTHYEDETHAKDEARDRWLISQGIETLRIPASEVYRDLSAVTDGIVLAAETRIAASRLGLAPSTTLLRQGATQGGPPPAAALRLRGR